MGAVEVPQCALEASLCIPLPLGYPMCSAVYSTKHSEQLGVNSDAGTLMALYCPFFPPRRPWPDSSFCTAPQDDAVLYALVSNPPLSPSATPIWHTPPHRHSFFLGAVCGSSNCLAVPSSLASPPWSLPSCPTAFCFHTHSAAMPNAVSPPTSPVPLNRTTCRQSTL